MNKRETPINLSGSEFRQMGYQLIDELADFLDNIQKRPVTPGETPARLQKLLNTSVLPDVGRDPKKLLEETTRLLLEHSLFNGHPKFFGYITSSPAPLGMIAELLASAVNPNVGAQILSPIATEIEKQTIKWIADFIGVTDSWDGILVSGGNMANFTAFLAARTAVAGKDFKTGGIGQKKLVVYCSRTTHTWVEKAMVLFGHGTNALRWIETESDNRISIPNLKTAIQSDLEAEHQPFMVIGTAGDVSTGMVDDLATLADVCKAYNLWFHIDGAYGGPAAVLPELSNEFHAMAQADSIALDPHKWLYSPLEAGCTLLKNPNHLIDTFSSHPVYYNFDKGDEAVPPRNFFEYGLQNSRGFRALKVWLVLQQVGKNGYIKMIRDDIALSKYLFQLAAAHSELEAVTQNLSITTFRYVPQENAIKNDPAYLNKLNEELLDALQYGGQVFLSNAVVHGNYCLRACIVNFRTTEQDICETIELVVQKGRAIHSRLSKL